MTGVSPCEGGLVVPDLTLPGSGSQGIEGEKRGRDCSCTWAPAASVLAQQGETNLNRCNYSAVAASYILSCLSWWKTAGLWAGNPTLQCIWLLTGYRQRWFTADLSSCHAQGSSPVQTALASLPPRSVVHELPGSCSGLPLPWHVRRGWLAPQRVGWWASAGAWGTAREGTVHCCCLQAHHASSSLPKRSPSPQHTPACCLAQCPSPVRCACGPDISSIREQPCCRFTAVRRNSRELVTKITIFKTILFLFFF